MITVADKSLERPIKSYFVLSLIYSFGTKSDTPSGFLQLGLLHSRSLHRGSQLRDCTRRYALGS